MIGLTACMIAALALTTGTAHAGMASLDRASRQALARLYGLSLRSKEFGKLAYGVLVFPRIVKAGFLVGGMSGDGVLYERGRPVAFFNISGGSYGLQAGAETYGYALFFMKRTALDYVHNTSGWAIGSGPSIVVANKGITEAGDTTTLTQDVYAVPFGARGLMGSLSIQGTKITPIHPRR